MLEVFCDFPALVIAPTPVHLKCDVVVNCEDSVDVATVCSAELISCSFCCNHMEWVLACQVPQQVKPQGVLAISSVLCCCYI